MSPVKDILLFIVVMGLAGASGYAVQRHFAGSTIESTIGESSLDTEVEFATLRPEFAMADIDGQLRNISEWDGKIILLNFWATWCPPCMEEIPDFIALQNELGEQGLQIVGIAIDEEQQVRNFAEELGMNYPIMAADNEAIELSRRYGNSIGGLPYTVVINRNGEITDRIMGELSKIKAEKILERLGLEI